MIASRSYSDPFYVRHPWLVSTVAFLSVLAAALEPEATTRLMLATLAGAAVLLVLIGLVWAAGRLTNDPPMTGPSCPDEALVLAKGAESLALAAKVTGETR